jgi:hypothetical protein
MTCHEGNEVRADEMGRACGTQGGKEEFIQGFGRNRMRENGARELETDKWQAVVNTVMNTQIPYNAGNSCRAEELVAFPEGLCPRRS